MMIFFIKNYIIRNFFRNFEETLNKTNILT